MALDRERLKKVFADKEIQPQLCSYSERLDSELPFSVFTIENVGDVAIPVSSNAFEAIRNVYHNQTVAQKKVQIYHTQSVNAGGTAQANLQYHHLILCIVDGKYMPESTNNSFGSENLKFFTQKYIEKMCQVTLKNIKIDVEAKIDSLVLLVNSQSYARVFNWEKRPGSFGYMLIKLPVEGDNGQSLITVTYRNEVKTLELGTHASVFMVSGIRQGGRQDFEIRQSAGSRSAFLIFNLIWKDAYQLEACMDPCGFPVFIKDVHEVNETLSGWKSTASNEDFICVPLLNHYTVDELNLDGLKSADSMIARTLLALDYVQVHFATITSPGGSFFKPTMKDRHKVCLEKVKQLSVKWMSSKETWKTPPKQVVVHKHLVGEITSKMFPIDHESSPAYKFSYDSNEEELDSDIDGFGEYERTMNAYYTQMSKSTDHPVLLCRPRWGVLTGKIHIKQALADLHIRYPGALKRLMHGKLSDNDVYLIDFHKLICFITNATNKIDEQECIDSWPLLKLLAMAQRLHRFSHGLKILEVIADRKCLCGAHDVLKPVEHFARRDLEFMSFLFSDRGQDFVQNAMDGKSLSEPYIGEFVIRAGWQSCAAIVLRMLDSREVSAFFVSLAKRLYFNRFIDGMLQVIDKVIEKLSPSDEGRENRAVLIENLIELYILLHKDGFVGSQKFYNALLAAMKKYDFRVLWIAFQSLKKKLKEELEVNIFSKILIDTGDSILNCDLNSMCETSFLAVLEEYANLDARIVEGAWKMILTEVPPESQQKKASMLQRLINHVKTDEERIELLKKLSVYPEASQALDNIVDSIVQQIPPNGQSFELNHSSRYNTFELFFYFVALAEEQQQLQSPKRLEAMKIWASRLGVFTLIRVLRDIRNGLKTQLVTGQRALIHFMLHELVKNASTILQISESTLKEVVLLFLWFGNDQLTECLIQTLGHEDVVKYPLIDERLKVLFEVRGICGEPLQNHEAPVYRLERNHVLYLLKVWFHCLITKNEPTRINQHYSDVFRVFYNVETSQPGPDDKTSSFLLQFLPQLTSNTLRSLTIETFKLQTTALNLKSYGTCFNVYRSICSQLSNRPDFKEVVSSDGMQLMDCFLWIADENLITGLVRVLCSSSDVSDVTVSILKSEKTQQLAKSSQVGFKAFNELLDDCIRKLSDPSSRTQTWAIPDVSVPTLPNGLTGKVQKFLRDPNRWTETFGSYKTELGARNLGARIAVYRPSWGLRFMAVEENGSYKCLLTKQRKFDGGPACEKFKKELPSLRSLKHRMSIATNETGKAPSPPKRQKTELSVVITL